MSNHNNRRWPWFKIVMMGLAVVLTMLYLFRKPIFEHKVTKAKMEMLKRMYNSPPKDWDDELKHVVDSMLIERKDSITQDTIANH